MAHAPIMHCLGTERYIGREWSRAKDADFRLHASVIARCRTSRSRAAGSTKVYKRRWEMRDNEDLLYKEIGTLHSIVEDLKKVLHGDEAEGAAINIEDVGSPDTSESDYHDAPPPAIKRRALRKKREAAEGRRSERNFVSKNDASSDDGIQKSEAISQTMLAVYSWDMQSSVTLLPSSIIEIMLLHMLQSCRCLRNVISATMCTLLEAMNERSSSWSIER